MGHRVWWGKAALAGIPAMALAALGLLPDRGRALSPTWSGDGHRIVCTLAWTRLTPGARVGIREVLGSELTAASFAEGCVWADEIRGRLAEEPEALARFRPFTTAHYVNFPPSATALGREGCTVIRGEVVRYCVLDALDHLIHVVEGGSGDLSRGEALRFLIHFVGDLHQPLHAGYGHDRGGNDRIVNVMGRADQNLHWVWDTFMVAHGGEPWDEMAERLGRSVSPLEERRWVALDPMVWAAESYAIVESQVYRDLEDGAYVGQTYYDRNAHTAERRLQMAGVRLAAVLNHVFDPEP